MAKSTIELMVEGMDCNNCATSISRFLERKGLEGVFVNFQTKEVRFEANEDKISLAEVKAGIHKLGYTVMEDNQSPPWWTLERKLLFSAVFTFPLLLNHFLMMAGIHIHWLHDAWWQLLLCLPVFALGVAHFGQSAFKSLRGGVPNMDVLIFMGSTAAFVYSLVGTLTGQEDYIFYETAATIITLVLLGNWFEKRAVEQTTTAISELSSLQVERARRLMPSGAVVMIDKAEIAVGDRLLVNEGDKIPADGRVAAGAAEVDEAMLTGESLPVGKAEGDKLVGGALLAAGTLEMIVTAAGKDTVLYQMIELVKTAQRDKPDIQRLADRTSAIFVPVVVGISLLTLALGYFVFGLPFTQALMNSIAVLVISCPCAMGLATPTAVMVGVGRLARNGILIKGGQTVETMAGLRRIVFDKTGTLTDGEFQIRDIRYHTADTAEADALLYHIEKHSSHPIAQAIVTHLAASVNGHNPGQLHVVEEKGVGLSATHPSGRVYRVGSARALPAIAALDPESAVFLTTGDTLLASVHLEDRIRPEAQAAISALVAAGIDPVILSGDKQAKTAAVAKTLGVSTYYAEQLPADKLRIIGQLSDEAPTAMVGDGINDAPALSRATIGISLSQATQAAIQSAQVVLLNGNLAQLPKAISISQATLRTIRQNLFWAFAYNVVAIPIAAMGYLNPMWGALFMAFSDVVVIGNSIRLRYKSI